MIIETFEQGSAAWHKARLGIPTASHFDEIITPVQRKPAAGARAYQLRLLSEWLLGTPSDAAASGFMDRGKRLEPEARNWYAYEYGIEPQRVGIVLRDDRMVGASPDALVGDDGLLEIKCPSAPQHLRNVLEGMGGYFGQTQGALWLTGRKWIDLLSYNPTPGWRQAIVRYERDEEYIAALEKAAQSFISEILAQRAQLLRLGFRPAERIILPAGLANDAEPF